MVTRNLPQAQLPLGDGRINLKVLAVLMLKVVMVMFHNLPVDMGVETVRIRVGEINHPVDLVMLGTALAHTPNKKQVIPDRRAVPSI